MYKEIYWRFCTKWNLGIIVDPWIVWALGAPTAHTFENLSITYGWYFASAVPLHQRFQPTMDCVVCTTEKSQFISGPVQVRPSCSTVNCKLVKFYFFQAVKHYVVSKYGNGDTYVVLGLFCLKYGIFKWVQLESCIVNDVRNTEKQFQQSHNQPHGNGMDLISHVISSGVYNCL